MTLVDLVLGYLVICGLIVLFVHNSTRGDDW